MLREIIRPESQKLMIDIPEEYVGQEVEILVFSRNEIESQKKEEKNYLLDKFEKISKNRVKSSQKYVIGLENEVNNDIF